MGRGIKELLLILAVIALVGLWAFEAEEPEKATTLAMSATTPSPTLAEPTINGVKLGMPYEEIVAVMGPPQSFIPPESPKPKILTFGRELREDGLGYADLTEVGFDSQERAVYVSGTRMLLGKRKIGSSLVDLEEKETSEGLREVFGENAVEQLRQGRQLESPVYGIRVWVTGGATVFKFGDRP